MKKITILLLPFLLASCYNTERSCKDFKDGKFKTEATVNGVKYESVINRNDSIAVETYASKTDTFSVHWVSDCEYIMRNLHPKNQAEKQPVDIKILTTSEKTYTFEYGIVDKAKTQQGKATRIN